MWVDGDVTPFKCKSCNYPTELQESVTFVYWEQDWLGIVLPTLEGVDTKWMSNRIQYLIYTTMPERDELPNKAIVFGDLDEFLTFIQAPEREAMFYQTVDVHFSLRVVQIGFVGL